MVASGNTSTRNTTPSLRVALLSPAQARGDVRLGFGLWRYAVVRRGRLGDVRRRPHRCGDHCIFCVELKRELALPRAEACSKTMLIMRSRGHKKKNIQGSERYETSILFNVVVAKVTKKDKLSK
jgi:hypothetical protein